MSKLFLFYFLLVSAFIVSCSSNEDGMIRRESPKGDVIFGGTLRFQSPEKVENLFPLASTNTYTRNITCQMFETLLITDMKTMRTLPNLAKSYTVSKNARIYDFVIRQDVFFHPNVCFGEEPRKMTVQDVKYSLDMACSGLELNKVSYLLTTKVKGADEFHTLTRTKFSDKGVEGIRITSDSTFQIELLAPFSGFEKILAHHGLSIIAREAIEMYGDKSIENPVGTGPFELQEFSAEKIILKRFPEYWKNDRFGNQLPYLDAVEMTYSDGKRDELENFRNEKIDFVLNIPVEQIEFVLGSLQDAQKGENVIHRVLSEPSMSIMYIGFANQSKEFRDVRVRKAFNMAVNRNELVNSWLGGEGWPAEHGFIPPLDFYPNDNVKPLPFSVSEARRLLAEAGYPKGVGFPKLDIYVNATKNSQAHRMTKGIVYQIKKNLGIELGIRLCTIAEREKAVLSGAAKIWRAGWIADYAHPENFLNLFYGRNLGKNSSINTFQYNSPDFDSILTKAIMEQNESKRNDYFLQADQKLVDDAVVMPILTEDLIVLVNVKVKNLTANPMEILDLSTIFVKKVSSR